MLLKSRLGRSFDAAGEVNRRAAARRGTTCFTYRADATFVGRAASLPVISASVRGNEGCDKAGFRRHTILAWCLKRKVGRRSPTLACPTRHLHLRRALTKKKNAPTGHGRVFLAARPPEAEQAAGMPRQRFKEVMV